MSTPVSASRTAGTSPSPEELANLQALVPSSRPASGAPAAKTQQGNTVSAAPASPAGADAPRAFPTGTLHYYKQRADDFRARNPGTPPPPYYLQYGDKYVRAFSALGPQQLSPQGLAWRDKALKLLQEAMEKPRTDNPAAFSRLERDPEAFRKFAYGSHVDAYLNAGLLSLPAQDLSAILTTPDLQDLLNEEGLEQVLKVLMKTRPEDMGNIVSATASETVRTQVRPVVEKIEQLERELEALRTRGLLNHLGGR